MDIITANTAKEIADYKNLSNELKVIFDKIEGVAHKGEYRVLLDYTTTFKTQTFLTDKGFKVTFSKINNTTTISW